MAVEHPVLKESIYSLPPTAPKLLGTIIQNYRPRDNRPSSAFQPWIDRIQENVASNLLPTMQKEEMALGTAQYGQPLVNCGLTLSMIPNFNSLVAASQENRKPVFALSQADLGQAGKVWDTSSGSIDAFYQKYGQLAQEVSRLIAC
jgi:hypothetical protein